MAALLAGNIAVPAGFWFAGITALPLAFTGAGVLFLPLFILSKVIRPETGEEPWRFSDLLPKLIRLAMKADTGAVLEAFGKNGQTRKVFRALFTATAGLVLAQVVDPSAAQAVLAAITGAGV
jgi:hypothetical protein